MKKERTITRASAKSAARDLQQFACKRISELLGIPWGKDKLIASREMGQSGADIRLVGDALDRFPFAIECKNEKTWNMQANIRQAMANSGPGTDWMLIMKRRAKLKKDRIPPVVVMDAEAFFELLRRAGDDRFNGSDGADTRTEPAGNEAE